MRLRKSFADNMIEIQDDYRNSLSKLDIIPVVSHLNRAWKVVTAHTGRPLCRLTGQAEAVTTRKSGDLCQGSSGRH